MKLTPVEDNPFASYAPVEGDPFNPPKKPAAPSLAARAGSEALGALEAAANLGSASVAPAVAGLAGLGALATNEAGLTHTPAADVVHEVGGALTYEPMTPQGKRDTAIVNYPFEKLAEAGQYVGDKTLQETGSPTVAAAAYTAVNALPILLPGVAKKLLRHEGAPKVEAKTTTETAAPEPASAERAPQDRPASETPAPSARYTPVEVDPFAKPSVSEMSPEQMRRELLADEKTGLPNRRALHEAPSTPVVGMADLDGLKWVNDTFGHDAGDSLLQAAGQALHEASGGRAYRLQGDEFAIQADTPEAARASFERANQVLSNSELQLAYPDGTQETRAGFGFSYGTGSHERLPDALRQADVELQRHKAERQASGQRGERGQPIGRVVEPSAEGDKSVYQNPGREENLPGREEVAALRSAEPQNMMAGANSVGLNAEHAIPEVTAPAGKPISRQDVLRPFLKTMGVPVYEGRVKGSGTLGFYLPKKEAVRIKRKGDLEVTAHEMAHLIDDRTPEIQQAWRKGAQAKTYREELKGVSYDQDNVHEGFAEFVRLWMTQPEEAAKRAPEYSHWFNDFVERSKYGPALKQARGAMQDWYHQSDLQRARSKVGVQKPINAALDGLWDRFRQSVSDDLHGLYRMERNLKGKAGATYETARLTRAAYTQAERAFVEGHPVRKSDGSFAFEGKGLQQILDPVSRDLDNFLLYAIGRSSAELKLQGRENLFTATEIKAMRGLETPEFRRAFDEYQAWNRAVVDFAQELGIINPESRKLWQRAQYLPMYRADQALGGRKHAGIEGNWNGIHRLTGGTGNLNDMLGNIMQNASRLIVDAIKNETRQSIADLADNTRGGGRFMVKIAKDTQPISVSKDQIRAFVYDMLGLDKRAVDAGNVPPEAVDAIHALEEKFEQHPDFLQFWMRGQAPKGGNVIAVMRQGKPDFYEVADPLLYRAIESLNRPARHWLVTVLNYPKRIGQASVTLTVDFMMRNIARDTLMGAVMSKNGFRPVLDSLSGMKSRIARDPAYREAMANGVGLASYLTDEKAFRKHLERFYTKKGINTRYVLDTPEKIAYGLETIADAFETATRLGEYKRARGKGANPREAAYQAREISTDFAMRGDSQVLGFFYDTVMFLKPMVNSFDRLYRGLAHDEQRLSIAAKTGALATFSAALYLYNRSIQQYQDLPDWDKDLYWHFFIPTGQGEFVHLRMPKLWEIGAVSSLSERTMEHIVEDKPDNPMWRDSAHIIGNLFYFNGIPQALAPLYEQATNKITFTGAPIENQSEQSLAPWARSDAYTPRTLREMGKLERHLPHSLQLSPDRTEALLRGYFNTWATYALTLSDAALFDDKPDMRVDQYPVVKSFFEGAPERHTKYANKFYEMLRSATEARRTMHEMAKQGNSQITGELEHSPANMRYRALTHVNERLQAMNREMKQVHDSKSLSPEQKRTKLDELQSQRNALMKLAVKQNQESK